LINEHDIKDMWPGVRPNLQILGEIDPNGKSLKEPGAKADAGKSAVYQGLFDYFPQACMAVADVSTAGASKYSWKGWEKVPDGENRYRNAVGRHILKRSIEGEYDPEGFMHDAQIAWNALAVLELVLRSKNATK
jgi:Domain of unknown function (DUF5664)